MDQEKTAGIFELAAEESEGGGHYIGDRREKRLDNWKEERSGFVRIHERL